MSTYASAEAAILTLVRSYASGSVFTAVNSAIDDWLVADAESDEAAVLTQVGDIEEADAFDGERGSHGTRQERYRIGVHLLVKVRDGEGGPGAADAALKTLTAAMRTHLRQYERLNGATGIKRAQIERTSQPQDVQRRTPGAPRAVLQTIVVLINGAFAPVVVEYSN